MGLLWLIEMQEERKQSGDGLVQIPDRLLSCHDPSEIYREPLECYAELVRPISASHYVDYGQS
jgi:hypothetical protein